MFCVNCGTELPEEAKFCLECGKPQKSDTVDTGGGGFVKGDVATSGGGFAGRDVVKTLVLHLKEPGSYVIQLTGLLLFLGLILFGFLAYQTPEIQTAFRRFMSGIQEQPTPVVLPRPTPINNTWINPKDGAVYVKIPEGAFPMGTTPEERTVSLSEFWIMQTEVTNEQYSRCVQASACTPPSNDRWNNAAYANHPVTNVDWFQARDYATWVGGRLPTEAEWEKACRGTDGRIYPWGNDEPNDQLLNFEGNEGDTTEVGSYSPQGDSPYGVADMAGNVWEWTAESAGSYPMRGGSWTTAVTYCVFPTTTPDTALRTSLTPNYQDNVSGFRVVLSSPGF